VKAQQRQRDQDHYLPLENLPLIAPSHIPFFLLSLALILPHSTRFYTRSAKANKAAYYQATIRSTSLRIAPANFSSCRFKDAAFRRFAIGRTLRVLTCGAHPTIPIDSSHLRKLYSGTLAVPFHQTQSLMPPFTPVRGQASLAAPVESAYLAAR